MRNQEKAPIDHRFLLTGRAVQSTGCDLAKPALPSMMIGCLRTFFQVRPVCGGSVIRSDARHP